jgi:putative PIN family toxin of toxin-antitoxin system
VIRALLDSNVVVSGLVRRHPAAPSVQILDAWRAGDFQLILSEAIMEEVARTLAKSYFRARLSEPQVERALLLLRRRSLITPITVEVTKAASHAEDDLVLAAAVSAHADYLVTGDAALLELASFHGIAIKSPREFVDVLGEV